MKNKLLVIAIASSMLVFGGNAMAQAAGSAQKLAATGQAEAKLSRANHEQQLQSARSKLSNDKAARFALLSAIKTNDQAAIKRSLIGLGLNSDVINKASIVINQDSGSGEPAGITIPTPWGPIVIDIDIRIKA
jgi:uncharacterized membrane protein YfhO